MSEEGDSVAVQRKVQQDRDGQKEYFAESQQRKIKKKKNLATHPFFFGTRKKGGVVGPGTA